MSDLPCAGSGPAPRNRPGLPHIRYRDRSWADYRQAMLDGLPRDREPLAGLKTDDAEDITIALLDSWATACDVLSFYTERLAQESYLGTAAERTSLAELGKLIAYRMDPGVAATTLLAFTLERPPAVAVPSTDPGMAVPPLPGVLTLPAGLRVQSVPGPGQLPQTFETIEPIVGRPEWNSLPVVATAVAPLTRGTKSVFVGAADTRLAAGDAVLLAGVTPATTNLTGDRWDLRTVVEIEQVRVDCLRLELDRALGSTHPRNPPADDAAAFAMRKRLKVFGHNAPQWAAMSGKFHADYPGGAGQCDWPGFLGVTPNDNTGIRVDIDGTHPDIVVGSWVVVSREVDQFYRELYEVIAVAQQSRAEFAVSGPVTVLTLRGEIHQEFGTPRDLTVYAVSEQLRIAEEPDIRPLDENVLIVDGDCTDLPPGRTLVVAHLGNGTAGHTEPAVLLETVQLRAQDGAARTKLTLTKSLQSSFPRADTVVYANVAAATHGETVREVLGSGDARRRFQRFTLQQGPLTHVPAATVDGSASTLRVSVDGVTWTEVDSLCGAAATARGYSRDVSARNNPTTGQPADVVVFGDGHSGSRLTTGTFNVRAVYRKGIGAAGNLATGQLSQATDRPLGLRAVTNPIPAAGGVDPEPGDAARQMIPISTRTLGRAVSAADYADFAAGFTGVALAVATVVPLNTGPTIVVTVSGPDGNTVPEHTLNLLAAALYELGDPLARLRVLATTHSTFRLAARLATDPDRDRDTVTGAMKANLATEFGAGSRSLAQPVHASVVIAAMAATPGVVAVDLDRLYLSPPDGQLPRPGLTRRLLALPARLTGPATAAPAELLTVASEPFDWLTELT